MAPPTASEPPAAGAADRITKKSKKKKIKKQESFPDAESPPKLSHEPAGGGESSRSLTQIAVKPGRQQASSRQLNVPEPPEGGYSTGYYRVLLETKRVEMLCRSLSLQYRHVALLRRVFDREDDYRSGEVTVDEFFHAIHEERRALTMGMFENVGLARSLKRVNFDQFVLLVVTFASLSRKELLHYAFTLFDKDDSGIMDEKELRDFCGNLKAKNGGFFFQKNVDVAQKKMAERDHTGPGMRHHAQGADGLVDFEDLQDGSEHFQVAFYPLLQFQRNIQTAALGEAFWSDVVYKKAQIERIVHYMRLHKGHLPPLPFGVQLAAIAKYTLFLLTGGGATTVFNGGAYALRKAAITKFAEEERLRKEEEEAAKKAKEDGNERMQRALEGGEAEADAVADAGAGGDVVKKKKTTKKKKKKQAEAGTQIAVE